MSMRNAQTINAHKIEVIGQSFLQMELLTRKAAI